MKIKLNLSDLTEEKRKEIFEEIYLNELSELENITGEYFIMDAVPDEIDKKISKKTIDRIDAIFSDRYIVNF